MKLLQKTRAIKLSKRHIIWPVVIAGVLLVSCLALLRLSPYNPRDTASQYFRAKVVSVQPASMATGPDRTAQVRLLDGPDKGHLITIAATNGFGDAAAKRLPIGSQILLSQSKSRGQRYAFIGRWYMPGVATLFMVLLALVVVVGAWRGITSVLGLALSIGILASFVVPAIVQGHNAFVTCIEGAVLITLVSVFVAHGFSKRTTVAFMASVFTLLLVVGLTAFASYVTGTSEVIDESSAGLLYAAHPIDIAGLLTGGVVIASLGALFDITTGQAATVDELYKADRKMAFGKLFRKGMSVGREHIAALINTLALVYVGVALPSIVTTIVLNQEAGFHAPLLVNLNTEVIAEEVVRTAVASIAMLLALPVTTWLAAYLIPRWTKGSKQQVS